MEDIIDKHRKMVEALGYSKECAEEVVHSLKGMFDSVIDISWGVHPAQQCRGKLAQKFHTAGNSCAMLGTKPKQIESGGSAAPATER